MAHVVERWTFLRCRRARAVTLSPPCTRSEVSVLNDPWHIVNLESTHCGQGDVRVSAALPQPGSLAPVPRLRFGQRMLWLGEPTKSAPTIPCRRISFVTPTDTMRTYQGGTADQKGEEKRLDQRDVGKEARVRLFHCNAMVVPEL